MKKNSIHFHKGFTLVELMVSVGIFVFMTSLMVAKYGTFNQSILITNNAYDVALILRNAQSYGLNVKSRPDETTAYSDQFNTAYGVQIKSAQPGEVTMIPFYADADTPGVYGDGDVLINRYALKNFTTLVDIRAGSSAPGNEMESLDITFKRPNPDAIIRGTDINGNSSQYSYGEFKLRATNGATRTVTVRTTGQISVMRE